MDEILDKLVKGYEEDDRPMALEVFLAEDVFDRILAFKAWCDLSDLPDQLPPSTWQALWETDEWEAVNPFTRADFDHFLLTLTDARMEEVSPS